MTCMMNSNIQSTVDSSCNDVMYITGGMQKYYCNIKHSEILREPRMARDNIPCYITQFYGKVFSCRENFTKRENRLT